MNLTATDIIFSCSGIRSHKKPNRLTKGTSGAMTIFAGSAYVLKVPKLENVTGNVDKIAVKVVVRSPSPLGNSFSILLIKNFILVEKKKKS